jgi:putative flippase GtrA
MNYNMDQTAFPAQTGLSALLARRPVILQLLRFAAIGVLNTALDFALLNFFSKSFGIESGTKLAFINIIGFAAAVLQSYFWNRSWAFSVTEGSDVVKNFIRLIAVGGVGAVAFVAVLVGAKFSAVPLYYLLIVALFLLSQVGLWYAFKFHTAAAAPQQGRQLLLFVVVSLIGVAINSLLVGTVSQVLVSYNSTVLSADLLKNVAKLFATVASLIWNFIGYKLFVFKK